LISIGPRGIVHVDGSFQPITKTLLVRNHGDWITISVSLPFPLRVSARLDPFVLHPFRVRPLEGRSGPLRGESLMARLMASVTQMAADSFNWGMRLLDRSSQLSFTALSGAKFDSSRCNWL